MGNGEGSDGGTETWKGQTKRERDRHTHTHTDSSETEGEVGKEQNRQNHPQMRVYKGAKKAREKKRKGRRRKADING